MERSRRRSVALLGTVGLVLVTFGLVRLPGPAPSVAAARSVPVSLAKTAAVAEPAVAAPAPLAPAPLAPADAPSAPRPSPVSFTSARLIDRAPMDKVVPVALRIDALNIAAPVVAVGAHEDGEMEVPAGVDEVAWYRYGPSPGQAGSAVLAAHVDMAGQGPGVFAHLAELTRDTIVVVEFADGSSQRFEVVNGAVYHKDELDSAHIFAREGAPLLTLITCGGDFNPSLARYDSNVVVYAAPVDDKPGRGS